MEIDYTKHTSLTNGGIKITSFGKGTGDVTNTIIDTPTQPTMSGLEDLLGFNRTYSKDEVINKIGQLKHIQSLRPKNDYEKVFLQEEIDMLCELVSLKDKQAKMNKLLNLLKEKRVDLGLLNMIVANPKYKTAKRIANVYNTERRYWALALKEEDVTLLVEWIKEIK